MPTADEIRALAASLPDCGAFAGCHSLHEVLICVIASARHDGDDEIEQVRLVLEAASPERSSRRRAATVMAKLGYSTELVDLVRGRRKRS